jgi:hypothetical protein
MLMFGSVSLKHDVFHTTPIFGFVFSVLFKVGFSLFHVVFMLLDLKSQYPYYWVISKF